MKQISVACYKIPTAVKQYKSDFKYIFSLLDCQTSLWAQQLEPMIDN